MTIYKATNKNNGMIYVGQTIRSLEERMKEHCRSHRTLFDRTIHKLGIEQFVVEVIDTAETIEELNEKEIYWIDKLNSMIPYGYNQCEGGGNTVGYHHTEAAKKKMSDSKKESYIGEGNPFFNKKHTAESRKKMSDSRKGMKHISEEQVKRLRESHTTKKVRCIENNLIFSSVKEAAEKYNLKETHISRVCKGKRKTTGGFHWEYT